MTEVFVETCFLNSKVLSFSLNFLTIFLFTVHHIYIPAKSSIVLCNKRIGGMYNILIHVSILKKKFINSSYVYFCLIQKSTQIEQKGFVDGNDDMCGGDQSLVLPFKQG